jgi:hypothetical protein
MKIVHKSKDRIVDPFNDLDFVKLKGESILGASPFSLKKKDDV